MVSSKCVYVCTHVSVCMYRFMNKRFVLGTYIYMSTYVHVFLSTLC